MIVSDKYKFIFARNTKTASSSLTDFGVGPITRKKVLSNFEFKKTHSFSQQKGIEPVSSFIQDNFDEIFDFCSIIGINDLNHIPMVVAKNFLDKDKYNSYFKFSFVRNPYDRAVSAWKYVKSFVRKNRSDLYSKPYANKLQNFKDWILYDFASNGRYGKYGCQFSFTEGCDFIGRYENLEEDYKFVMSQISQDLYIPMPKRNQSENTSHYSEYYDKETKKIVSLLFEKDIQNFGYKFES